MVDIPEQAVKAAIEAAGMEGWGHVEERMMSALTAAAPYMSGSAREHALDEVFQILQQYSEHPNEVVSFVMVEIWDAIRSLPASPGAAE